MPDIFEKQLVGLDFAGTAKVKGLPQSTANGEAVVHEQLSAVQNAIAALSPANSQFTALLGDGTATSFIVAHSLNSKALFAQVIEKSSGTIVNPLISIAAVDSVTVDFGNNVPATEQYELMLLKLIESPTYSNVTLAIAVSSINGGDTIYQGETGVVTFTFNQNVTGMSLDHNGTPMVFESNGTVSDLVTIDAAHYTATFTPNANLHIENSYVQFNKAYVQDVNGLFVNPNTGLDTSNIFPIYTDTARPSV